MSDTTASPFGPSACHAGSSSTTRSALTHRLFGMSGSGTALPTGSTRNRRHGHQNPVQSAADTETDR